MGYSKLKDFLINNKDEDISLSYTEIGEILGKQMPKSLKDHGGITKKSTFGKAVLEAGFIFENSYKNNVIIFHRNKEEADRILAETNTKNTNKKINIFLNVIFPHSANYINKKGNIGHEIIDIFGADNNKYYYYLNPWGLVDKNNIPDIVISICQASTGLYKILNKAVIKQAEKDAIAPKTTKTNLYKKQMGRYLYNDRYLESYYSKNPGGHKVLCSLECEGIYEPKQPLYLAFNDFKQPLKPNFHRITSTTPGQTTKFINFSQSDQNILEELVNKKRLWNTKPIKSFKEYAKDYDNNVGFSYFKEIGIEKQELQYSNAIRFFLSYFNLTNNFLAKIGSNISKTDNYRIDREKYNIDLLFTNFNSFKLNKTNKNEKIIIVENKIKANVTPSDNDKTIKEQIEKVYRYLNNIKNTGKLTEADQANINFTFNTLGAAGTNAIPSQLSKYYIYAFLMAKKRGWSDKKIDKDIECFFLCPEYSKVMYEVTENGYLHNNSYVGQTEPLFLQEKYKLITYKNIKPVFEDAFAKIKNGKEKYFLEDFLKSIKKQSDDRDNSLEQEMIELFYERSKDN